MVKNIIYYGIKQYHGGITPLAFNTIITIKAIFFIAIIMGGTMLQSQCLHYIVAINSLLLGNCNASLGTISELKR